MPFTSRVPWSSRTSKMVKNCIENKTNNVQSVSNIEIAEASSTQTLEIYEEESTSPMRRAIPSLSFLCHQMLQQSRFVPETAVIQNLLGNTPEKSLNNIPEKVVHSSDEGLKNIMDDHIQNPSKGEVFHISAENEEQLLHRTPEREFVDFDSDDDIADPDYSDDTEPDEDENQEAVKMLSRKRKADPMSWKKNITKKKRYSGLEYKTDSGSRVMNPKSLKEPCHDNCKLSCRTRILEERRQMIHSNFWSPSKTVDMRRQYIASMVSQIPIKRRREKTGERRGKRIFTNCYSFDTEGKKETVCKKFFLNTLSISQQTVDTAIKKKKEGGIVTPDKRGRHPSINKIPEEVRQNVRNHISKFPTYESHYSRERTKKKYLGNHLNISRMYGLYLEECTERGFGPESIAKEWLYSEIFNYEYNYSFKSPDNDTCDLCDQLQLQIREAESLDIRKKLQTEYDQHLADTTNRYKMKSEDKKKSRDNLLEAKVIMIDLQKCLPTPDLHNSQSFYSLKLWTYNLTIQDATCEKSFCMMWDESVAGRGGNEVASCLIKWVEQNVSEEIKEITIWSDNCPSQNRNILMIMCYFFILRIRPNITAVNHKFLARGHTHLEADVVHSTIERERKKLPQFQIVTPWDWQQMVRLCGTKKQFNVVNMEQYDFKEFKHLFEGSTAPYINKKKDMTGNDFLISHAVHLQVRRNNPGILYYKTDFNKDFLEVDFHRRNKSNDYTPLEIPPIRESSKPISAKKYNHLQKLLKWVPKRFHDFYKKLEYERSGDDE
ncbi:uncharacterized protein LOC115889030 [Sitophilus oryzae]|uniref:Uncharacterized protein LOC115879594 n=1 Tax=Sitophilus oryzae TaxID=7048 RepID=A0A6J2XNX3_SITOR|nr:uncharacterized protein LOC115879594 [Sitophilus oryzae]XP_030762560.1 uncharacterized protein LOC115887308 [Sitophilus oryzae]XP_030764797.1 uncharacterized protein LOC115889030 [Sitophilus oryzae]